MWRVYLVRNSRAHSKTIRARWYRIRFRFRPRFFGSSFLKCIIVKFIATNKCYKCRWSVYTIVFKYWVRWLLNELNFIHSFSKWNSVNFCIFSVEMSSGHGVTTQQEKKKGLEDCLAELSLADPEVVRTALTGGASTELGNYSGNFLLLYLIQYVPKFKILRFHQIRTNRRPSIGRTAMYRQCRSTHRTSYVYFAVRPNFWGDERWI